MNKKGEGFRPGGGAVCRFTVGRPGTSALCVRYITRPIAVREREEGLLLYQMPEEVVQARDFETLRKNLTSYAWVQETREQREHRARGQARSHYRCVLSFEHDIATKTAKMMVSEWLAQTFKNGRGIVAIHRNTERVHAHIWLQARETTGRKVNLSACVYRTLDETWGRIYARELGRDPEEQRARKEETRRHRREPHLYPRPERSRYVWKEKESNENERERETPSLTNDDGTYKAGTTGGKRGAGGQTAGLKGGLRPAPSREPGAAGSPRAEREVAEGAERAVRYAFRLHDALVRLGESASKEPSQEKRRVDVQTREESGERTPEPDNAPTSPQRREQER